MPTDSGQGTHSKGHECGLTSPEREKLIEDVVASTSEHRGSRTQTHKRNASDSQKSDSLRT